MLRSAHSSARGGRWLVAVGVVLATSRARRPAGRSRRCAASRRRRARASRAAAARPAAWRARPRSRRSSSPARCAGSGPRCRSPWICWTVEAVEARRPSSKTARSAVGVRRELGYDGERGVEPVVIARRARPRRRGRPRLGREVLAQERRAPRAAPRRAGSPRRRSRRRPRAACRSALGEQVADAGQRQVPAVAGRAQELLEHRELQRLRRRRRRVVDLQPAVERGDVLGPGPGQHLVDRDVGVDARGDLAEHLHQRVLAEGHRGVGLLAGEQRRVRLQVELVAGQPVERAARSPVVGPRCGGVEGPQPAAPSPRGRAARRRRAPSRSRGPPTSRRRRGRAGLRVLRRRPAGPGRARCRPRRRRTSSSTRSITTSGSAPARDLAEASDVGDGERAALAAEPAGPVEVVGERRSGRGCVVGSVTGSWPSSGLVGRREPEPVEAVAAQGQQVGQLADRRERHAAEQLDRDACPRSGAGRARPAAGSGTGC